MEMTKELPVCSLNTVKAIAARHPETINRLFIREELLKTFAPLCKQLAARKRPYKMCDDDELFKICKTPHHQGVVAMIVEPDVPPLTRDDLARWADERLTGIVLHSVGNDMNLGAIIRAAAFFGVEYVVISELDADAKLSTAAYRTAEGGMEYVTLRAVRQTSAFLRDAASSLLVIGADGSARRRLDEIPHLVAEHNSGVALVVGNEERGLPPEVKEHCKALLRIPGSGNIESLNVSQAAAIFLATLYEA
jgi:TrmH RNA methyltransferase